MRIELIIGISVAVFQGGYAQTGASSITATQGTVSIPVTAASSTPVAGHDSVAFAPSPAAERTKIMDYKSVYEAPTVEEEVKMAAERFSLTPSQQDIWLLAATDRREGERLARLKLDSTKGDYSKTGVYMGLRASHNTFHETIMGYLTPNQKQAFETDRLILQEKQKRIAKLPPPPPPVVVDTIPKVDSTALAEQEVDLKKNNKSGKKSKKKKKQETPQ